MKAEVLHAQVLGWASPGPQVSGMFGLAVWLLAFRLERPASNFPFQPALAFLGSIAPAARIRVCFGIDGC